MHRCRCRCKGNPPDPIHLQAAASCMQHACMRVIDNRPDCAAPEDRNQTNNPAGSSGRRRRRSARPHALVHRGGPVRCRSHPYRVPGLATMRPLGFCLIYLLVFLDQLAGPLLMHASGSRGANPPSRRPSVDS
jgi:hypothetical protein